MTNRCIEMIFSGGRPAVFHKVGLLEHFAKFKGNHLCRSHFFNKVAGLQPASLLKRDSGRGLFLCNQLFT